MSGLPYMRHADEGNEITIVIDGVSSRHLVTAVTPGPHGYSYSLEPIED